MKSKNSEREIKKKILDYLERQLFRNKPRKDEVCHLTYDMWKTIYKDVIEEDLNRRALP